MIYFLFVIGFILLIKGADLLVEGSSSIAKKIGVSELIIGLTIVSLGTSAPELLVNIITSIKGSSDLGVGNIVGSNISNILLILGISAIIYPLKVKSNTTWKEIPLNIISALLLFIMVNDIFINKANASFLSRSDGLILMIFFILFMSYTFGLVKSEKAKNIDKTEEDVKRSTGKSILMTIVGIIGLAYGGKWVVDGAVFIAQQFGLSEAMIGLTIIAIGTSLPELATSATAAYKHKTDIAIGNIVGSNLFNVFWVLGLSAVIKPIPFNKIMNTDIIIYLIATIFLFIYCFTGKKKYSLDKKEGITFVIAYIAYIIFLVIRG